jgi:Lrp/AsnC family leucine-responsive transcriptional regulator
MVVKIDSIDRKILCELDANCRVSISKLAKKLRIGRNVAAYRIKRLEDERLILNYVCSLNLGKLGYKTYKLYIKSVALNPSAEKELSEYLLLNHNVIHILKLEGYYYYSVTVVIKSIVDLDELMVDIRTKFKQYIKEINTSVLVYSRIFKLDKLLLDKVHSDLSFERYDCEKQLITLDPKDAIILHELSQKSNESIIDVSKNTALSVDVVKYRIKIIADLVNSFRAIIDFEKLGFYQYILILKTSQMTRTAETKLFGWCSNKKQILFYNKRIGTFDFELTVMIKSIEELTAIIRDLKNEFPDCIDTCETVLASKLIKLDYYPFKSIQHNNSKK